MIRIHLRIGESLFVLEERAPDGYTMRIQHGAEPEALFAGGVSIHP